MQNTSWALLFFVKKKKNWNRKNSAFLEDYFQLWTENNLQSTEETGRQVQQFPLLMCFIVFWTITEVCDREGEAMSGFKNTGNSL